MDINLKAFLSGFNEMFTLFCVFPAMVFLGLYLTFKLRFIQITKIKLGFSNLMRKKKESEGNMSHFEAMSAVLAGNFGTGNISGMAVAMATGGPGALVWMWIMAFLGGAIQYASCLLGVKYRTKNSKNEFAGGPMYYLFHGLGCRSLAIIFSLLTLFGALTVGIMVQVNSMALPLENLGFPPLICGVLVAICVALVTLGGLQRTAKFASLFIPLKAVLYLGTALFILLMQYDKVLPAFGIMLTAALNPQAVFGGIVGISVLKAITSGFDRGIFATDAGTGIVPILQSGARTTHPVVDGLVTLVAPLLVMIVCTTTGLVLIVTGAWQQLDLHSTNMVTYAFTEGVGSPVGAYIVIFCLLLFGYTTVLAWGCCAEKAAEFLGGPRAAKWAKVLYIIAIPLGALLDVNIVWVLADICVTALLVINMIGIAGLSKEVVSETDAYFSKNPEDVVDGQLSLQQQ